MSITLNNIKYNNHEVPILFDKFDKLPIFNLQLVFKNSGYINDTNLSGLTNISTKMLNEGTLKEGAVKFASKLENNAIEIDANIGLETVVIEISCLSEQYTKAMKYLKQLLKNPNISQETLDKIKNITLSKLAQKQDDFDFIASSNLKSAIYKDTALKNSSIGNKDDILKISIDDVKQRLHEILNINNLIVVSGGNINKDTLQNDLINIFKYLDTTAINNEISKININKDAKSISVKKDTEQSYIYFAAPLDINFDSKELYKAKVASFILGSSGFGSRLMEEIRVKNGLAYSVYGYFTYKKSHSNFTGYLQTEIKNTKKAQDMVIKIVDEFISNGVTKEELDSAKLFLSGSEPLRTETFSQRLSKAFNLYYKNLPFDYTKKELENINNLTLEELNSFIKQHTEISKLTFSIVTK